MKKMTLILFLFLKSNHDLLCRCYFRIKLLINNDIPKTEIAFNVITIFSYFSSYSHGSPIHSNTFFKKTKILLMLSSRQIVPITCKKWCK